MKKCQVCPTKKKWLPQCDECLGHFCHDHLKPMDGGALLCADCVIENAGAGSSPVPEKPTEAK